MMEMTALNSFNILDKLSLNLKINENPYGINLDDVMSVGARINPKRSFLFISKLLGKHLEVNPNIPKVAGYLLANRYTKYYYGAEFSDIEVLLSAVNGKCTGVEKEFNNAFFLGSPTLFIGFAETATGLGHSVFSAFLNSNYIHTTREEILSFPSVFDFEEEHSHATGHSCFPIDKASMYDCERIVLVDDEITTGKTALNLIYEISKKYMTKKFTVLSILDLRTAEWIDYQKDFCLENGIEVDFISLINGEISVEKPYSFENTVNEEVPSSYSSIPMVTDIRLQEGISGKKRYVLTDKGAVAYSLLTGRFGIDSDTNWEIESIASSIGFEFHHQRKSRNSLVLGVGEFIYIPSRIASYMGAGVMYKSTTRSPIYADIDNSYPINSRIEFSLNGISQYLYNIKDSYEEVFILHETPISNEDKHRLVEQLAICNVKYINFCNI